MFGSSRGMLAVMALALSATLLPAAPAAAGTARVLDAAGDSGKAVDLLRLDVRYAAPTAPRRLGLRVGHAGLPPFRSGTFTTVTFWIDVDGSDPGPEFVTDVVPNTGGLRLRRVRGWERRGSQVQPCPGLRAAADVFSDAPVVLRVPRACLGDPGRVRAAVVAIGETAGGDVVGRDWIGGRRHWSPWVRR